MDPSHPWAQSVVVQDDRISYVGDEAGARLHAPANAEVIDLRGGMLLPGFIDAHDHLATMAVGKLGVCLAGITGKDAILDAIRAYVHANPGLAVYRGFGWYPGSFAEQSPRREWLDAITGDVPMVINSADTHDLWCNSAALRSAGIDASTPDPEPSQYYVRDPDGTPTGHAVEGAACIPILDAVGTFTVQTFRQAQALTLDRAPSYGMTGYFEAGALAGPTNASSEPVYADFIERDLAGQLNLRVAGTVWTRSQSDDPHEITAQLIDWHDRLASPHVGIAHCKLWADGTLFSGGSLLLQPTCGPHGSVGQMTFDVDHIAAQVMSVQQAGFDMHIHVDGDGSARAVLDAIEHVQQQIGRGSSRHAIAHNTLVDPIDLPRYAHLGVLANCTPLWGTDYHGQYRRIYTDLLGADRVAERLFPYGDLVRSGAVVTYGADLPGVDVDEVPPLLQIESLLTRQRPGFPDDEPLGLRQRIGLHDALRGYTVNGAYQLRMEDQVGSIEVGKQADLVALGADLFQVSMHEVHQVPVTLTMMGGRITHREGGS